MRKRFVMMVATALLVCGAAFAQSQQGGYLGQEPGATAPSTSQPSGGAMPQGGSHQGGYLGVNPGGHQQAMHTPDPSADMRTSPTAWCRNSPEPDRCRGRAADEDRICAGKVGDAYARCRFAMDQMYTH